MASQLLDFVPAVPTPPRRIWFEMCGAAPEDVVGPYGGELVAVRVVAILLRLAQYSLEYYRRGLSGPTMLSFPMACPGPSVACPFAAMLGFAGASCC